MSTNIPAFDATLGSLTDVQVTWNFGLNYSGIGNGVGGTAGYGMGGNLSINGVDTNGGGLGGGSGIDSNSTFAGSPFGSVNVDLNSSSTLWNSVSGDSPLTVSFGPSTNGYFNYSGAASGTVSTFRDVSVSFLYIPVPEPSTYVPFGLAALALVAAAKRRVS